MKKAKFFFIKPLLKPFFDKKIFLLVIISLFLFFLQKKNAFAQIGGRNTFAFTQNPHHAWLSAMGGINVSSGLYEINNIFHNPAVADDSLAKTASLSFATWQADAGQYQFIYADKWKKGLISGGIRGVNYGKMQLTDATGAILGDFRASDWDMMAGYGIKQGNFYFGGALHYLVSQIESYNAHALAINMSGVFKHPKHDFTIGLAVQNAGFVFKNYIQDEKTNLPLDVQLGTSFKPKYMPVRFSLTAHHLHKWDIVYLDPYQNYTVDLTGQRNVPKKTFFDNLARHFVLGTEILFSPKFHAIIGYNHLVNREMKIRNLGGTRGFSFGFGIYAKKYIFQYGYSTHQIGVGKHFFTLQLRTHQIFRKIRNN